MHTSRKPPRRTDRAFISRRFVTRASVFLVLPVSASVLVAASGTLSCGGAGGEKPLVALATSPAAETRFAGVRQRWMSASRTERAAMRAELTEIEQWLDKRQDGLEPVARAYLAVAWLDAGVPNAAEAVARPLYDGPIGVTHDLGVLVKGIALRRTGHPKEAIATLQPIVGKLIDPFARPLLDEEMTEALIDEGRFDEAIAFAQAWLRAGATSDRKALHEDVARVLHRIPLEVARRTIDAQRTSLGTAGYSPDLILILGSRLEDFDEQLVESDGGVALAGDGGKPFDAAGLDFNVDASTIVTLPLPIRFDPRAVALIVPTSAAGNGSIATAAIRGATSVFSAQSVPSPAKADGGTSAATSSRKSTTGDDASVMAPSAAAHHLGVFDTGGTAVGVLKAVDAAERDGAAVIIGGITDLEANALAFTAQTKHLPTILLRAPTAPPKINPSERVYYVVLGTSTADYAKVTMAAAATVPGLQAIVEAYPENAAVAKEPPADPLNARCDATAKTASGTAFPIALWSAKKVSAVVILGDARCADRVAQELVAAKPVYRPQLVLGPAAMELIHDTLPLARMVIGAGQLPADDAAPAALRDLWIDQRAPVGWWTAFGHDAAVLAMSATPGDLLATVKGEEIQKYRVTTLDRLAKAKGELWSTDAKGVVAGVVPRTTFVRSVGAGGSWHPAWLADAPPSFYK
jgi:hypothetical protein